MNDVAVSVLHLCLEEDFAGARQQLRRLPPDELKRLRRASMALQNLVTARLYAIAQHGFQAEPSPEGDEIFAASSNRDVVQPGRAG